MQVVTVTYKEVTHADGSHSIVFEDGIVFGPYGPGQCEAMHAGKYRCRHGKNHVGCHSADLPVPPGRKVNKLTEAEFTIRWG